MAGVEHELLDFLKGTNHELVHVFSVYCSEKERRAQIAGDVQTMSQMFGQHVVGFAYPYGIGAKQSAEILHAAGVRCARTAHMEGGFRFPADPLKTNLSCGQISRKAFQRLNQFFAAEPTNDDLFFLMFAHGYESDFGT